jgi:hypothetical protein
MKNPLTTAHITVNAVREDGIPDDFHYCGDCRVRSCKERLAVHVLQRCTFFEVKA